MKNLLKKRTPSPTRTRKLNPKMGLLGLLGFLGFFGLIDGNWDRFIFFGFFGFFFEGKMSDTLIDERFLENKKKAQYIAITAAYVGTIITFVILAFGKLFLSTENLLIVVQILISLSIALAVFLSEYLLYRYDHDDSRED